MRTTKSCTILLIFAFITNASAVDAQTPATADLPGWKLIWQDEFAGERLDEAKWSRCKRGDADWHNTMSDDPDLLVLENGVLHLRGIKNERTDEEPAPYLTAGVTSEGKFSFKYGKVQIRARFKNAQGAWPALWMMGDKGPWPTNGEIDLMEHLNFDSIVYQTMHSAYSERSATGNDPPPSATAEIEREDWNTYGCEWDAEQVVLTVNGKPTFTYPREERLGKQQWPFRQKFYFILSMQIGGTWVNETGPTNPADYPAGLEVDWVRVYERSE